MIHQRIIAASRPIVWEITANEGQNQTVEVLRRVVLNENEAEQCASAYGAMRKVAGAAIPSADSFDFEIGNKQLQDIDWNWVRTPSIHG